MCDCPVGRLSEKGKVFRVDGSSTDPADDWELLKELDEVEQRWAREVAEDWSAQADYGSEEGRVNSGTISWTGTGSLSSEEELESQTDS